MEGYLPYAAVAALFAVVGFLRWKLGIKVFFLLVVLDGAMRKWFFPETQQIVYFFKDFLLLGVYLRVVMDGLPLALPQSARSWGLLNVIIALFVTIQIFNFSLPTMVLGIVGWKSYLWYVPLAFVLPHFFDSTEELLRSLRNYALLAFPVVVVLVFQFFTDAESVLNIGLLDRSEELSMQSGGSLERVRVAGTFTFVSGLTAYVSAMLAVALCLLVTTAERSLQDRWIAYLLACVCILSMLMSGSRAPIVTGAVMIAIFLYQAYILSLMRGEGILRLGIAALVVGGGMIWVLPEASQSWLARMKEGQLIDDTISERTYGAFAEIFQVVDVAGFGGYGAGATHNSAGALIDGGEFYDWLPILAEGEMGRVLLELGIVGWLLVYGARILIIVLLWQEASKATTGVVRAVLACICAILIVVLPGHIMINPVANAYYYGAIGIAFAAIRFSRPRSAEAGAPAWRQERGVKVRQVG